MCVRRGARARKATRLRLPEKAFFTVVRLALSVPGSPPVSVFSVGSFRCVRRLGHLGRLRTGRPVPVSLLVFWFRGGSWGARGLVVAPTAFFCALFSLVLCFFCAPFSPIRLSGVSSGALGCFGHKKPHENTNQLRKRRILRSCQFLPKWTAVEG